MAQKIGANIIVRFVNALQKRSREEQHLNTFGEEDDLVRARADPVDLIVSALDEGDESYQNADQSSQLAFIAVPMKTRFERTRREMAAAASQTRCEVPTATQPSTKKPRAIRQYILEEKNRANKGFIHSRENREVTSRLAITTSANCSTTGRRKFGKSKRRKNAEMAVIIMKP